MGMAVGTYRVIPPSLPSASWGKSRSPSPHPKSRPSGSAHLRASALSWPDGVCKLESLGFTKVYSPKTWPANLLTKIENPTPKIFQEGEFYLSPHSQKFWDGSTGWILDAMWKFFLEAHGRGNLRRIFGRMDFWQTIHQNPQAKSNHRRRLGFEKHKHAQVRYSRFRMLCMGSTFTQKCSPW